MNILKKFQQLVVFTVALTCISWLSWKAVEFVAWASGTVRYVSTTGSDANTCVDAQNISTPKLTITAVVACMAAGDITYARGGTYTDANINLPAGVSAGVPTTLEAYQNELVVIRSSAGAEPRRVIYNTGRSFVKFWNIEVDGVNAGSDAVKLDVGSHNFTFGGTLTSGGAFRCQIHNSGNMGFSLQGISDNVTVSGCDIYDNALLITVSPYAHGLYIQKGNGFVLENSIVRRNGCNGIQLYTTPTNAILRRNKFYDNARVAGCGTQVYVSNDGHLIEYNEVWNDLEVGNTYGIRVQLSTPTGNTIRHNTVYNGGTNGIYIASDATSTTVQNNLIIGSTNALTDLGTGSTLLDNLGSGTASSIFKSIASGSIDLSLKDGSAPIDGGTPIGLAANGGTPEQGAHEVPILSSCTVEAAAPSVVRVTFTNNLRPPMRPSSGVTGVTFRKNGASNAVISSTRTADNLYEFTVTNAYGGADTVDLSIAPASTNMTDSALIGSNHNQPFISTVTNTSCVNNISGSSTHTYTQERYELHGWRGIEASPDILPHGFPATGSAENFPNYKVYPGSKIRVRFAVVCGVSNCPSSAFHPYFSTGGGYAIITDDFNTNDIKMCGLASSTDMPQNGQATTNQLSTAGTFIPGGIVFTANDTPAILGLNTGYKTEMEYCMQTDVDASGFFDIRLYLDNGSALNTYTSTPRLVVNPIASGGM